MWLKRKQGSGLRTEEPIVHLFLTDNIAWIFQFSQEVQLKASCVQQAILACGQVDGCASTACGPGCASTACVVLKCQNLQHAAHMMLERTAISHKYRNLLNAS